MKRYGPYTLKSGHEIFVVCQADGTRTTVLSHREVVEAAGIPLAPDQVVHHRNEVPNDNRLDNLEVMSRADHTSLHQEIKEVVDCICPQCGELCLLDARRVRSNQGVQEKAGPFCSRKCAGTWSQAQTTIAVSPIAHGTRTGYRRKCRCSLCRAAHAAHCRKYRK